MREPEPLRISLWRWLQAELLERRPDLAPYLQDDATLDDLARIIDRMPMEPREG